MKSKFWIGFLACLFAVLLFSAACAGGSQLSVTNEKGISGIAGAGSARSAVRNAVSNGYNPRPARGANVDLWVWAKHDGEYDMTNGKKIGDVLYTVIGSRFTATVEQGRGWLKVSNRAGFGWFYWSVANNTNTTEPRVGMIRLTDSSGTICTITFHQAGSAMVKSSKVDKKRNVTLKFAPAKGSDGTAIFYGKNKLNDDYYYSSPDLKKIQIVTGKKFVHKKMAEGYEHWYELRPYKKLGSKKLIAPSMFSSYGSVYYGDNDPFFDVEVVDINPPGFDW